MMNEQEKKRLSDLQLEVHRLKQKKGEIDWEKELAKIRGVEQEKVVGFLIHKVPEKLKHRFKEACTVKHTNMRAQVLAFMEWYSKNAGF